MTTNTENLKIRLIIDYRTEQYQTTWTTIECDPKSKGVFHLLKDAFEDIIKENLEYFTLSELDIFTPMSIRFQIIHEKPTQI